jgi:hypothetical protein
MPAHVSCTERWDSVTVSTKAPTSATTSATSSMRRNSASRCMQAAGPRTSEMPELSASRRAVSPQILRGTATGVARSSVPLGVSTLTGPSGCLLAGRVVLRR